MDSSRFWNSVRSLEDWRRTRDLWDRCRLAPVESRPGEFHYARADATRAYQPSKLKRFTRELVYLPGASALVVFDRVRSTDPSYRKAWLLHGVDEPRVEGPEKGVGIGDGGTRYANAATVTFDEGEGRLRVHTLLPREREVVVRGGPGFEFWTPGDAKGGAVGLGPELAPRSARRAVPCRTTPTSGRCGRPSGEATSTGSRPPTAGRWCRAAWRIEVSPARPALDDVFLNVLEIGDRSDATAARRVAAVEGHALAGAAIEGATVVLFASGGGPG